MKIKREIFYYCVKIEICQSESINLLYVFYNYIIICTISACVKTITIICLLKYCGGIY